MDPNEIIRPQTEETVWIYTRGPNDGQVAPPNHKDAVQVIRTTVYRRDGRVEVWQRSKDQGAEYGVLMPSPISYTDEKIAADFQKDKEKREQAPSTVSAPPTQANIVSRDPNTGALTTSPNPNYVPPAGAAGDWHTEGTPDGQGGFDNSRPIMVRTVNGKREERQPTAKELEDWNLAGQMTRNPGGKTDKQLADEQKDEDDRAERAAAQARATRASELSALKPGTTVSTIGGQKYTTIVTPSTTPGGQPTITHLGPDNKPIAALPPEPPESTSTTITRNGRTFIQTTTKRQDGTSGVTFTDTAGNPVAELPREGATELPPGMPELDISTPDTARASYLAQVKWAQEQVRAGKMTRQEAVELTTPSHQAAESVISGAQQSIENARATRGQDITQEGNRLNTATSQYANAQRAVDDVWKVAPRGGTQAGDVLLGSILMQQLLNRQTQGSAGPVVAPGVATTPLLTAPAAAITGPNAIGAGAVPGSITPTGVAAIDAAAKAAPGPPEIPMTPERVQGIMQNPVFRPSPEAVMPAAAPDPEAVSVEQMPASIRRAYGRTIIDGILQQYGVAS